MIFHTVKIKSRAADSEARYERRANWIEFTAPGELGTRDRKRDKNAGYSVMTDSVSVEIKDDEGRAWVNETVP